MPNAPIPPGPPAVAVPADQAVMSGSSAANARVPLRRAVYVHVSDLTSAYNIDHKKLEQELARVKVEHQAANAGSPPSTTDEASVVSIPQKRLHPPKAGFNLCVLVGQVNIVVDKLRVDRSRVRLAEVEVGDETGTVSLRARDEQIDVLTSVSSQNGAVVLRNCTLELFQGKHIRLAVTKWGKLSVFPDTIASTPPPPSKINKERNFSLIDLSVVASEMVENQPPEGGPYQGNANRDPTQDRNRVQPNRQPFQPPQYHQQQRRPTRDRRQARPGRGVGSNPLAVPFPESPMNNPQMRYGIPPNFQGYGDPPPMDLHASAYGHYGARPDQQAQQMLHMQQQYHESMMQQRQMHLNAMHEHQQQGDAHRSMLHQMAQQGHILHGASSFDSGPPAGDFPALPVARAGEREATSPTAPDLAGPWSGRHVLDEHGLSSSPGRMNQMNPQANVFAPSYVQPQGRPHYGGYNPYEQQQRAAAASQYSQQQQQQQQHAYTQQNLVYAPVPTPVAAPNPHDPNNKPPQQQQQQ